MSATTQDLFAAVDGAPTHVMVRDPQPITWPDSLAWLRPYDIHLHRCAACGYTCDSADVAARHTARGETQVNL